MTLENYLDIYYPNKDSLDQTYKNNNCAEGILTAMIQYYDLEVSQDALHQMKAFGGGLQKGATCGLLIGSYAGLTHMYSQKQLRKEVLLKDLLQSWYDTFEYHLGAVNCLKLRDEVFRCKDNANTTAKQLDIFINKMFIL